MLSGVDSFYDIQPSPQTDSALVDPFVFAVLVGPNRRDIEPLAYAKACRCFAFNCFFFMLRVTLRGTKHSLNIFVGGGYRRMCGSATTYFLGRVCAELWGVFESVPLYCVGVTLIVLQF